MSLITKTCKCTFLLLIGHRNAAYRVVAKTLAFGNTSATPVPLQTRCIIHIHWIFQLECFHPMLLQSTNSFALTQAQGIVIRSPQILARFAIQWSLGDKATATTHKFGNKNAKLSVKAEGVQLIEAGSDIAEVEKYSFEDLIYVQRSGPEHSLSLTWAHRRHKASIKTLTTV